MADVTIKVMPDATSVAAAKADTIIADAEKVLQILKKAQAAVEEWSFSDQPEILELISSSYKKLKRLSEGMQTLKTNMKALENGLVEEDEALGRQSVDYSSLVSWMNSSAQSMESLAMQAKLTQAQQVSHQFFDSSASTIAGTSLGIGAAVAGWLGARSSAEESGSALYRGDVYQEERDAAHGGSSGSSEDTVAPPAGTDEAITDNTNVNMQGYAAPMESMKITSGYGARDYAGQNFHYGIDLSAKDGTPVASIVSGTVLSTYTEDAGGNIMLVLGDDGYIYQYAHLQSFSLQKGDAVSAGQTVALSGSSGRYGGGHLHFSVYKASEAVTYLKTNDEGQKIYNINYTGEYPNRHIAGAVDPTTILDQYGISYQ